MSVIFGNNYKIGNLIGVKIKTYIFKMVMVNGFIFDSDSFKGLNFITEIRTLIPCW